MLIAVPLAPLSEEDENEGVAEGEPMGEGEPVDEDDEFMGLSDEDVSLGSGGS